MTGFPTPFGGTEDASFDDYSAFVPAHLPEPGEFLTTQRVLTDAEHVEFHQVTKTVFEERTVYDMTFNYNLAKLNLDTRHPDAGFRYAETPGESAILRAEFTPTTPFCPQTETLTVGAFRAWNDLCDRHDYDLVCVRVASMHHRSEAINDRLGALESDQAGNEPSIEHPDAPEKDTGGSVTDIRSPDASF